MQTGPFFTSGSMPSVQTRASTRAPGKDDEIAGYTIKSMYIDRLNNLKTLLDR